jgi:hypothetical protein
MKNKLTDAIVRCQKLLNTEGIERALEALLDNILEETRRWEKIFFCGKHSISCRRGTG